MDCIFCKIVSGEIPSERLAENEHAIAIRDISPQAPVHLLVITKLHSENIGSVSDAELPDIMALVREVVAAHTNGQYRLQFNTGSESGQTVFHTHGHVLSRMAA